MDIIKIITDETNKNITIKNIQGIIQHGSSIHPKLINSTSDYDYLVILNKYDIEQLTTENSSIVTINNNKKIHITCIVEDEFYKLLSGIENELLTSIFDLNILSTRLLSGEIIIDNGNFKKKIDDCLSKNQINNLVQKFVYQAFSFIKDIQGTSNKYLEQRIMENIIDSLTTALLIRKECFFLNLKHHPVLIEEYLSNDTYKKYLKVRFNYQKYNYLKDDLIKNLLKEIRG